MPSVFRELAKLREQHRDEGAWMWTNASILAVDVEVSAKVAASWLPGGLRLTKPAKATIFVADYPETSFGVVYREAAVLLHVKLGFSEAVHCPWMLVDDDVALILGREFLGYPKKMGEISLHIEEGSVRATVDRKGTRLIDISGSLGPEDPDAPPMFGRLTANVWGLLGLTLPKLIRFSSPEEITSARTADLTVEIKGSEHDPLQELEVGSILGARLYRANFGGGKRLPVPVLPVRPAYTFRNWALRYG
jgi:acetoacetate decarboxylase